MKDLARIANILEHHVAPLMDFQHQGCRICDIRHKKPAAPAKRVVHDSSKLKKIEGDIAHRRMLAGEPEPEAGSDSFRYRERQKWT